MFGRIFNSTLYAFTAYFILHVFYLLVKYLGIKFIGISDAWLYFTEVDFSPWGFKEWSKLKIFLVYGFPSFACLGLGISALIPFNKVNRDNTRLKLFLLWFMILSVVFFMVDFIKAPFFEGTMTSVYMWSYIRTEVAFLISILFMPFIPLIGYFLSKYVIKTANSREFIKSRSSRVKYFAKIMFIPLGIVFLIIALLLLITTTYPMSLFKEREVIRFLLTASILGFAMYFTHTKKYVNIRKSSNLPYIKKEITAVMLIAMTVVYILLYFAI